MQEAEIAAKYGTDFRRCLLELDVAGIIALHRHTAPHLPEPTPIQALISLHQARTMAKSIPEKLKAYSRRWLEERARMPSAPVIAEAVGIAVKCSDPGLHAALEGGMTRTVRAALADGVAAADAKTLRPLIMDAREKIKRGRMISI
jgi:hypothetical protein